MKTKEKVSSKIKNISLFMVTTILFIFNNIYSPSSKSAAINIPSENCSDDDSIGGPSSVESQELLRFSLTEDDYSNHELRIYQGCTIAACQLIDKEVVNLMSKIELHNKPYNLQVTLFIEDIDTRNSIFEHVVNTYPEIIRLSADRGTFKSSKNLWFAFDPRNGIPKESHKNSSCIVAFVIAEIGDEKFVTVVIPLNKIIFQLPGGFIKPGSSPVETLIKEIEEELGFNINDEKYWLFPKVVELPKVQRLNGGTGFVYPFIISLKVDTKNKYEYFAFFGKDVENDAKAHVNLSIFDELSKMNKDKEVKFVGQYILENYNNLLFRTFLSKVPFFQYGCSPVCFNATT